jgi:hypothetical protein
MSASPARPSTAWCHAALVRATRLVTMPQVITRGGPCSGGPSALALRCGQHARPASARYRRRGVVPWGRRVPDLPHGSRASSFAEPRESTRSAGHQGVRAPGRLHGLPAPIVRLDEADRRRRGGPRSRRLARVATSAPRHRRRVRHAPDRADAREPRQASSREASDPRAPRSPSPAPTASDVLDVTRPSAGALTAAA